MTKLRCWPGCRAQVVIGYPEENVGKVLIVTRLMDGSDDLWEFTGNSLSGHLGMVAQFVADDCLIPIDPPPGSVTDEEVKELFSPNTTKEIAMTGIGSFSAIAAFNANSHAMNPEAQDQARSSVAADDACQTALTPMTDDEREDAARRCGVAMEAWYSAYQMSGNPADLDRAYHCMGMQKRLLAGRSAAFVAKLESERGLA